jgi:hypothetical protein
MVQKLDLLESNDGRGMSALFREIGPNRTVTQCYIARKSAPKAQRRLHAIGTGWADALCFQHDRVFGPYGVKYFAIGHSSRCFSYIRYWVEKKIRRHLARACQRQGCGWIVRHSQRKRGATDRPDLRSIGASPRPYRGSTLRINVRLRIPVSLDSFLLTRQNDLNSKRLSNRH